MQSKATTVEQYMAELPEDRRAALEAVRKVMKKNIDRGFEEGMGYGMPGFYVPHSIYPAGYHCDPSQPLPFIGMASQKNYMSVYLMCLYLEPEHTAWFLKAWAETGKKLDMGKSCIRFKKIEDLALDVIGQAIKKVPLRKFIADYESSLQLIKGRKSFRKNEKKAAAAKKTNASSKKAVKKSPPAKKRPKAK